MDYSATSEPTHEPTRHSRARAPAPVPPPIAENTAVQHQRASAQRNVDSNDYEGGTSLIESPSRAQ
ncbi:hypothetical protein RR46_09230 [Papilio xuthus]|uniref:Uncharacterized protein n=1 Tax=Papilio xuthus TaxID=66420 RepID=A0A194PWE3_PAPXU|nr:hypothetical protein RR46_09230 [Papilio xuthus]